MVTRAGDLRKLGIGLVKPGDVFGRRDFVACTSNAAANRFTPRLIARYIKPVAASDLPYLAPASARRGTWFPIPSSARRCSALGSAASSDWAEHAGRSHTFTMHNERDVNRFHRYETAPCQS